MSDPKTETANPLPATKRKGATEETDGEGTYSNDTGEATKIWESTETRTFSKPEEPAGNTHSTQTPKESVGEQSLAGAEMARPNTH